jgi:hypothetical protein
LKVEDHRETISILAFIKPFEVQVSARLHPFVQYADDLDQVRLDRPVVQDMDRPADSSPGVFSTRVPEMKAAEATEDLRSVTREGTLWIGSRLPHRCRQERRVSTPALDAPLLGADRKNARDVRPGGLRQAVARHQSISGGSRQGG